MHNLDREPENLPLHERLAIAKQRGDDFILPLIDETYARGGIRNIGMPKIAEGIRALYEKAKTGDEAAKKELRLYLLLFVSPADIAIVGTAIGLVEAAEHANKGQAH